MFVSLYWGITNAAVLIPNMYVSLNWGQLDKESFPGYNMFLGGSQNMIRE